MNDITGAIIILAIITLVATVVSTAMIANVLQEIDTHLISISHDIRKLLEVEKRETKKLKRKVQKNG